VLVFTRMPKVTNSSHPLAGLRAICGFTREDVAKIAGITAASVQNIELNRAPMPLDAARRIEAATGCLATSLMNKGSVATCLDGRPYTRSIYTNYQDASIATPEHVVDAIADLQFRLQTLLAASDKKFLYVTRRLGDVIETVLQEAEVSMPALESIARSKASFPTKEMTVSQLQEEIGDSPVWQQWIQTHPISPKSKCNVIDECYQSWPDIELNKHVVYSYINIRHRFRIEFSDGQRLEVVKDNWKLKSVAGKNTPLPKAGSKIDIKPADQFAKQSKRSPRKKLT